MLERVAQGKCSFAISPSQSHLPELGPSWSLWLEGVGSVLFYLGEGPGGLQVASVQWCLKESWPPLPQISGQLSPRLFRKLPPRVCVSLKSIVDEDFLYAG